MIIKTNTWVRFLSLGCGRNCNSDTMVPVESGFLVSWAGHRNVRLGTGQCGNASPQASFSCLFSPGPRRAQQNAGEVVWLGQTRDWRSRKVWSLREPTCEHRDWEGVLGDAQEGIGRWWKHCLHGSCVLHFMKSATWLRASRPFSMRAPTAKALSNLTLCCPYYEYIASLPESDM